MRLNRINDTAHLQLLVLRKIKVTRIPVRLEACRLSGSWNSNHSLGSDPGECDLAGSTSLAGSKLLNLLDDQLILVEVFSLEFRSFDKIICQLELLSFKGTRYSHFRRASSGAKSSGEL